MDQVDRDPERSFTNNSITGEFPTFNFSGQMEYRLSDGWTSRTHYAANRFINNEDGIWGFAAIDNERAVRRYGERRWKRNSQQAPGGSSATSPTSSEPGGAKNMKPGFWPGFIPIFFWGA